MKIIKQSAKLIQIHDDQTLYKLVESAGRVCYKSTMAASCETQAKFIRGIIAKGHHSVLEHASITFEFITDRAVMAEVTRHRLVALSVQSQRYCCYKDPDSFQVIAPFEPEHLSYKPWLELMSTIESYYNGLLIAGEKPQVARAVLPQCFATVIRMTANIREWRHIFNLRTGPGAYPPIKALMTQAYSLANSLYPLFFEDLKIDQGSV
jgi:thymidylate synthase (FAD)